MGKKEQLVNVSHVPPKEKKNEMKDEKPRTRVTTMYALLWLVGDIERDTEWTELRAVCDGEVWFPGF